ncbi:hypothetical protein DFQ26_001691, partial [Actinomortierella ambigua]
MLDKILGRGSGKVVLDRVQVENGGQTVNETRPEQLKHHVRDWFTSWHGPRTTTAIRPEEKERWNKRYAPMAGVEDEWYEGVMEVPSYSEYTDK